MTDLLDNFLKNLTLNELALLGKSLEGNGREEAMIAQMLRFPATHEYLSPPMSNAIKSEAEADKLRNEGTANFLKRRLDYAMRLVNKSIRVAPHPPLATDDTRQTKALSDETGPRLPQTTRHDSPDLSVPKEERPPDTLLSEDSPQSVLSMGDKRSPIPTTDDKATPVLSNDDKGASGLSTESDLKEKQTGEDHFTQEKAAEKAPEQYLALARGYGNRSAILFHLERYHECVRDVDRALMYNQEESFMKKLLTRRDKCLDIIKQEGLVDHDTSIPSPPKMESHNPDHPSLSRAVRVDYSEKDGRYLVADRDILPGELIMVEEGHWETLSPPYMTSHCCNCFRFCSTPVPCPTCYVVIFCNEQCRTHGMARFHSRECSMLPTFLSLQFEAPSMLAVRSVIKVSFATLSEEMPLILKKRAESRERDMENESPFDPSTFRNLILCYNRSEKPKNEYYLSFCTSSVMATKIFQESGTFFVDRDGQALEPSQEDIKMTASALFILMMNSFLRSNSFLYDEKIHGGIKLTREFSTGTFPTVTMTKRSCCPSAYIYKCGFTVLVRVTQPILAGEAVTTHVQHHAEAALPERRELQKEIGFLCECIACQESWPTYQDLPTELQLKCPKCSHPLTRSTGGRIRCNHHTVAQSGRSDSCWSGTMGFVSSSIRRLFGKQQMGEDMDEMKGLYATINKLQERWDFIRIGEESEEDRRLMFEVTKILARHAILPCKLYHDVQQQILRCYIKRDSSPH